MSHLDPRYQLSIIYFSKFSFCLLFSSLATYNSLADPNLQSFFSNERIRSHLRHAGLISGRGEIISEGEYRSRLVQREHVKHVRHMLAENMVNRAVDMERTRQAEAKRQYEMIAKAALVNNIKESKKRGGNISGLMTNSTDMALLSIDSSCTQIRPKSANQQNEMHNEHVRISRLQSAHSSDDYCVKYPSKNPNRRLRRRRRSFQRLKSSNQRPHLPNKYIDSCTSSPCQITMVYYGPHTKVDYDHLVFEQIDEIIVMQQHCGGENLIVYKNYLKPGGLVLYSFFSSTFDIHFNINLALFTFESRRHSDYPFGLSLYVKGLIESRISTCCEYKHRRGVKLGGDRGHFAIKSVHGSKPCIRCLYEKQARLKKYAQSPKERDDENKLPITISLPVSDEPKMKETSVHRRISASARKESTKKTWQIIFYTSNSSKENIRKQKNSLPQNSLLQFSFLTNNKENETEIHEINMKELTKKSESSRQYSVSTEFKNIGKPEQIRLKIHTTEDEDEDEYEDYQWYLDYIEVIDPETQSHLTFPCNQWIRPSQEKTLQLSQNVLRDKPKRRSSASSSSSFSNGKKHQQAQKMELKRKSSSSSSRSSSIDNDPKQSPKVVQKRKIYISSSIPHSNDKNHEESLKIEPTVKTSSRSRRSSNSSKQSQDKVNSARRNSVDNQSNQSEKTTPRNDITNRENKTRYRVIIYPSDNDDGEFNPIQDSQMFLRLNDQTKETNIIDKTDQLHPCPAFDSGEKQEFELDLIQDINEQPKKLTIGYINSHSTAKTWKLEKIVLINVKTGDETTFLCNESLIRNESNSRAEKTFEIQLKELDDKGKLNI
ncbi:unnamed protein product [Rotaria sp. Silwood2]|nr:unnamed protein product [Rotaria sp. Silwood2]